MRSWWHFEIEW
ncbi:hypothetical protein MTR67_012738 [Solanum verrucosum]|uniref:Uncharacterized protein n=1 Tax=Solanum verrucosum TaxID=315347 RepID=A0AAF0QAZ3_SOLVR|nr:hypothetical protein MTR67_012738 [Solanum verrucosum]